MADHAPTEYSLEDPPFDPMDDTELLGPPYQGDTETYCDTHTLPRAKCGCVWGEDPDKIYRGQLRMAYRLAKANSQHLMYVKGIGWHVWDGQRWAEDEKDTAKKAVFDLLGNAWEEAFRDKDLSVDVRACQSASGVSGVLNLAAALPALRAATSELDADPHLFNVANGTLDLRDRQIRAHNPADRITRVTRGAYTPGTRSQVWDNFLTGTLPDDDVRGYLQRVIGQSVYGRVREHLFPVLTGTGANGKGTAYGAITSAMGSYATIIKPDLLMAADRGGSGPEMMELLGARLVVGSETEEDRQLDAATMKRLTGGDELTARRLYQEPVRWTPSHQLIYVTNHLPKVKGNDPAVWRRVRVLPFDVVVAPEDQDGQLGERLELEADAIVTWAINGWFDYEDRKGMDEPPSVLKATDKYQTDSDDVKQFIQDECSTGPHMHVPAGQLHTAWTTWAVQERTDPLALRPFAKELERLGYPVKKTRNGNVRMGLGLKSETLDFPE